MLGFTLLAMLIASQHQEQHSSDALQDHSFSISGFFCNGAECEATPRRLGASLQFEGSANNPEFDSAKHLKENWSVRLDCAVSRNHLKACRIVDQPNALTTGTTIALKLIDTIRLRPDSPKKPRAVVDIIYEVGSCPSWFCVATPLPPPPPATAK